jgi:hypothetical protein
MIKHPASVKVPRACAALVAALLAAIAAGLVGGWLEGVDFALLEPMKGLLAGATALLLVLRYAKVSWALDRASYRGLLTVLATVSLVAYLNFFAFHGAGAQRAYVHLHDVAHNYLGARYYAELGHADLYIAMLRAEAERYEDHFRSAEARDLESY